MDRADLELVVALDESGSLTAAAQRLHVAQPALSRRLQRLEREFGAPLFHRGRHGASPTVVGRTLVERSRAALAAIDRVAHDTADAAAGRAGRLRVGATPTLGAELLPTVLAAVRAEFPDVVFELATSGDSRHLRHQVRDGRLDVALAVAPTVTEDGVRLAAMGRQTFVAVVPAHHELASHDAVTVADLANEPIVALSAGEGLRVLVDSIFADAGATPEVAIETDEREMLVPFVAAGLGCTIVPEIFAAQHVSPATTTIAFDPPLHRLVGAFTAPGPRPVLVARFVDALLDEVWPDDIDELAS